MLLLLVVVVVAVVAVVVFVVNILVDIVVAVAIKQRLLLSKFPFFSYRAIKLWNALSKEVFENMFRNSAKRVLLKEWLANWCSLCKII